MSETIAVKRLQKEFAAIQKRENKKKDRYLACPDPENILDWYFVLFGLDEEGPYKDGVYLG